ncbi:hypothetical protein TL16_g09086 [Triparma laevis f. inornata]|uniref:Uncharacterized protein n=1 Tax=Triparma laevis f. inornata TaxID=1714386 RepID=A0A9W7B154_9STRA|nr:hypothetical protein TL16_g09086 [Triparma laevis f. inornata]
MSIRIRLTNRSSVAQPTNFALSYDPATFTYADLLSSAWAHVPPTVVKSITGPVPKPKPKLDSEKPPTLSCVFVDGGSFPSKTLEVANWGGSVLSSFSNGSSVEVRWRWIGSAGTAAAGPKKKQANKQGSKKKAKEPEEEADDRGSGASGTSAFQREEGGGAVKPKAVARAQPGVSTSNRSGAAKMSKMTGQTLSGGSYTPSAQPAAQQARRRINLGSSEGDVTSTLLSSTSGNSGNTSKFLRSAMSGAVKKTYEVSLARDRLTAVLADVIHFSKTGTRSIVFDKNEGVGGNYTVTYKKSKMEGRGNHVDKNVQILSLEELTSVVEQVMKDTEGDDESRGMLKGEMMSLVSARVFWSFVFHFPGKHPHEVMRSGEGSDGKNWDWTFLDERRREKSDKAKDEEGMEEWNRMIDTYEIDDLDKVAELQKEEEKHDGVLAVENLEADVVKEAMTMKRKRLEALERRTKSRTDEDGGDVGGDVDDWDWVPDLVEVDEEEVREVRRVMRRETSNENNRRNALTRLAAAQCFELGNPEMAPEKIKALVTQTMNPPPFHRQLGPPKFTDQVGRYWYSGRKRRSSG